ncbi:hypothetical protein AVEN_222350-1 [Araneus ventricosus]|uniref:Uncharacterized protein n=2 Tax=Araneus ventricosus TaxID=182803 RepID=A0A4Y2PY64_ARAVE|nr:hypothetical protein AVEN_222350-1 [Araneus ventricosus]
MDDLCRSIQFPALNTLLGVEHILICLPPCGHFLFSLYFAWWNGRILRAVLLSTRDSPQSTRFASGGIPYAILSALAFPSKISRIFCDSIMNIEVGLLLGKNTGPLVAACPRHPTCYKWYEFYHRNFSTSFKNRALNLKNLLLFSVKYSV